MPIIPSDWTGLESVVGLGGSSNPYAFCKTFSFISNNTTDFIELVGYCSESINREITVEVKSGICDFYWKNKDNELFIVGTLPLLNQDRFIDNNLGCLGLTVKIIESCELFITIRWDKDHIFSIYGDEVITPDLITVINNVFYVDESVAATYTDFILGTAYFESIPEGQSSVWERLTVSCSPEYFQIYQGVGSDPVYKYPTIEDPLLFTFYPLETVSGEFQRFYNDGENNHYESINIVSFDKTTNTFILGLN